MCLSKIGFSIIIFFFLTSFFPHTHRKAGLSALIAGQTCKSGKYFLSPNVMNDTNLLLICNDTNYSIYEYTVTYACRNCDFMDKKVNGNIFSIKMLSDNIKVRPNEYIIFSNFKAVCKDNYAYPQGFTINLLGNMIK